VAWLKQLGAQVYGYGLPPASRPNFFDTTLLDRGMTSIFGDVRDRKSLANVFAEFQPEIVIHCASRSNAELAQEDPVETFSTNVMGTVFVLEEARLSESVRAVVHVTSASEPENSSRKTETGGTSIHEASMACSDLARAAYAKCFLSGTRTAVATTRMADVIGGGDWRPSRIVPNLVRSLMAGEPVNLDGQRVHIWHVLDAVYALLLMAQKVFDCGERYSEVWDFGPAKGCLISASELASNFVALWDAAELASHAGEDAITTSNHSRNEQEVGRFNFLNVQQAIAWTVHWYRAFYADAGTVWRVTEDQIERYMQMTMACGMAAQDDDAIWERSARGQDP
jgi:CDP-glucose 4,6-dehydratase